MLFKKKPENDINQYFVVIARGGSNGTLEVHKTDKNILTPTNDAWLLAVTVKKAIKYAKKHHNKIWMRSDLVDQDIINYFEENVPHELWCWHPLSIHLVN